MTVVVSLDPLGQISTVHAAIPVRVVMLRATSKPTELKVLPLTDLEEGDTAVIATVLDPWTHLTVEQRETIENVAYAKLKAACNGDSGYANSVLRGHVHDMPIADQLETIAEEDDELGKALGFVPDTGDVYREDEDEEPENPVSTMTWGRTTVGSRTWHAFIDGTLKAIPKTESNTQVMPKYTGLSLCGIDGIHVVGPIPMAIGETPTYGGNSAVCEKCKAAMPNPKE